MSTLNKNAVGEVRPSQLLWTYGPGALIDLPNLSVITMGTDQWDPMRCQPVREPRLLEAVRQVLGPQVESLRMPPFHKDEKTDPFSAESLVGVPVLPFPRWLRCVKCGMLASCDSGLFHLKSNPWVPERTRYVHAACRGWNNEKAPKDADAVPARLLLACRNGHLDDFPWHYFVHGGNSACKGKLSFFESGASLQTENLWVKCNTCGSSKSLAQAFGRPGRQNLPGCRGRHPHLNHFDDGCDEVPRAVLLGSTNSWFPVSLSALAIPQPSVSPLQQIVIEYWDDFSSLESEDEVKTAVKMLERRGEAKGLSDYMPEEIWAAIEINRNGGDEQVTESDIKAPEWAVLTEPEPPTDYPHFMSRVVAPPAGYERQIKRVLLLERLREVNALLGFTRVEAPDEAISMGQEVPMASLTRGQPEWVPANQIHGEGFFIQFDEEALRDWENLKGTSEANTLLQNGYHGWRNARNLNPDYGFPGVRYTLLHTFSHLLIRELALECGYNAASIRERIYADVSGDVPQAGILVYTAAADSDGTLGGLVDLGNPEKLGELIHQALERARICSSDPLCAEHDPAKDRSLHVAACHACALIAETSCEKGNKFLDRSLLVPTIERKNAAFFE